MLAKYGVEGVSFLRFALSLPSFAQAAVEGDLSEYGGMFSEAKILEDVYGVTVFRKRTGSGHIVTSIRGPELDYSFNDDVLGTGTRHAMAAIKARLPELSEFATTPVLQFGSGISYSSLFDHYDFASFIQQLEAYCPDTHKRARQLFDSRLDCVMDGYRLVTLISDFLFKYRMGEYSGPKETTEEWEPFARPDEVEKVLSGTLRKSVKFSTEPMAVMQNALTELFKGESDWIDGNFIVYQKVKDPLSFFGGEQLNVGKLLDYDFKEQLPGKVQSTPAPPICVQAPSSDKIISDAIALVETYNTVDAQSLPPDEKVVAHYGSPKGKEIFENYSRNFVSSLFQRALGEKRFDGLLPAEWIQRVRDYLATRLKPIDKHNPDMDRILAMLAAGRTVAARGVVEFDIKWRLLKAQPPH